VVSPEGFEPPTFWFGARGGASRSVPRRPAPSWGVPADSLRVPRRPPLPAPIVPPVVPPRGRESAPMPSGPGHSNLVPGTRACAASAPLRARPAGPRPLSLPEAARLAVHDLVVRRRLWYGHPSELLPSHNPHLGFSRASRTTIASSCGAHGGRPGPRRAPKAARRRALMRCHRSSDSGRTGDRARSPRGSQRLNTARISR
jgi:hypothetical protein